MPRIRHLAIVSPNRERLVNFYTTAFEMRVVYGRPTSTHLSDGDFNLAIVDQKRDLKPGLYVLGFDVDDLQDLEGSLKKAGASSDLSPMPKDHDAEYRVLDPDGNRLDLAIHGWCVVQNLVSEPLKGFSSRMIIDACRPYEWMKDPAGLDSELKEALSLKWKKELFS